MCGCTCCTQTHASMGMCVLGNCRQQSLGGRILLLPSPPRSRLAEEMCREQEAWGAFFSQRCNHQQGRKRGRKQHLI